MRTQPLDEADIFNTARKIEAPAARTDYVKQVCGDDRVLWDRITALLRAHDEDKSFLESPPTGLAANPEGPPIPEGPGTVIGPYKLHEHIGEGGFGVVYLAEQLKPVRRRVALKIIKPGMDSKQVIARFEAERQALALMDHPNIARVLDAGATESGRPYFVMELVKGVAIIEYCDQCNLTTRERLELFISVCQAIQHAHQKGIIHRDVKPSNVMIAMQNGEATPKVIDFGVAKAINQRLTEHTLYTRFGQMVGTPMYMSPEQAEMSPIEVDTRSDIYSLGVLLYELLIGATPFDKKRLSEASYDELRRIICEEQPPPPSSRLSTLGDMAARIAEHRRTDPRKLNQLVRGDLDWIVMKALEKDRTRRYETADGLARDIERYLGEEPVEARPPSAAYRFRRFARRNRGYVTAAAAVFLALVAGLVDTTLQYLRAEDARMAESRQRVLAEQRETEAIAAREGERMQHALADQRYEEIIRLADLKRLADARAAADSLWPAHPEKIETMQASLEAQAAPLRDNLPKHEATLSTLRDQALEYDPEQQKHDRATHPKAAELTGQEQRLAELQKELDDARAEESEDAEAKAKKTEELERTVAETAQSISELQGAVKERRTWKLPDDQTQWQHDALAGLVEDLKAFVDPDPKKGTLASVQERLDFAGSIEDRSITGTEAAAKWAEAIADIAQLEVYGGLQLTPQIGLLPLRRDPRSGLWEFRHIQTGSKPGENPDAEAVNPWILNEDTGLVFVLIPGGTFWMGAQKDDPEGHNYDPQADSNESPVHEVTLTAFFVSKYEMT